MFDYIIIILIMNNVKYSLKQDKIANYGAFAIDKTAFLK